MTTAPPPAPASTDAGGPPPGEPGAPRPRSIAANSAALAVAQALVKALGFAVVFVLTRSVSVEEYGRYAFAIAFAALFLPLADTGADFHATRMVSRNPGRADEYLGASLALKTAILPLLALASLSVAWATGHRGETLLLVAFAVFGGWLMVMCGSYLSVLRAMRRMDYEAYFLIAVRVAAFVLALVVLATGRGVLAVGAVQVVATALGVPLVMFYAARLGIAPRRANLVALGRELLAGGIPFAATAVLVMVYFRIDMVMVSGMRGERSAGLYGAGTNVMFAALLASQVLVSALFPVIARNRSLADPEARAVARRAFTLSLLMSLPFAVGACVVPGPVLSLLYGAEYAAAARAFTLLMLTLPVLFVTNLVGNCLGAVGRQRAVLAIAGVNVLLNVGLNLVLIPRMDYAGAALATLLTELCGLAMFATVLRGDLGAMIDVRQVGALLAANAALAAVLLAVRGWPIAAVLVAGAFAYAVLVLALRVVRPADLRALLPAATEGTGS
jgi:O-antigen/teichoic acid export membrane protein